MLMKQFLPLYLATKGVSAVIFKSVTTSYLFSMYLLPSQSSPLPGRKRTGALLSLFPGEFMLVPPFSKSRGAAPEFECGLLLLQHALWAIITACTVEVFGAPIRGAGMGATGLILRLLI
ncbi:uncharacterized protein BCR38DRAFT_482758 [Pseudomassariella vexata]|uniref:Uncharacterized protein n=1 Tax=Pseudomassariella vexata TaxID=1141098 RepID=A0A1Y2E6E2_9PEZI|nr:uncharacterized protein BCR38DRAFT_482758 [Pseudomassariella vexata]ORY67121.1 hypothetical protein BCR38DRAFT_482758 [Pseudomassariella vexata]